MKFMRGFMCVLAAVLFATADAWADARQTQQPPSAPESKKKEDKSKSPGKGTAPANPQPESSPKPLFGGQVNLKSSRQSKDTATLGFNGLDPNGQVQKGFLAAAATSADVAKAQQLARSGVNASELTAFLQEGGLNATGGQQ